MITADQLLCHLVGDYILQSDWMASRKTSSMVVASVHACCYSLPFLLLSPSWQAMTIIVCTHALIDRFRLARYVIWLKNWIGPQGCNANWDSCNKTGYRNSQPDWLTVWLMIIADNIIHILINGWALKYL